MGKTSNVLVLGGCGFIGRHLVTYLIKNNLAEKVRVADKSPPQLSWFNAEHKAVFEDPRVEFFQANLVNPAHVERVFATNGFLFDYVINLASETRYGQGDEVYTEHIYNLGVNVATKSASCKVKRYIELSTAQVYESDKKASDEEGKLNPWTSLAMFKLNLEKKLRDIDGLDYVIIRPALVYGISDKHSLSIPRLIIGAVYKQLQEKMKLLWSKDLKMNTVHVNDVAIAIWFLCTHGKKGDVYNLVDKQDSTQGSISELVCQIFGIKYDFFGSVISNVAKLNMNGVVDESNEKHLAPWSVACTADKIVNTPLSPYLDKEILYNNHLHIEGKKIESLGFKYTKPYVTAEELKLVVQDYVTLGIFPPSLVG